MKLLFSLLMIFCSLGSVAQYEITKYFFDDVIDDVELNPHDNHFYVVQSNFDQVLVINHDMQEIESLYVGNRPFKITFDLENTSIYATLKEQGKVSKLNRISGEISSWYISETLLTNHVYDIAYGINGTVFVNAFTWPHASTPFAPTIALDTNSSNHFSLIGGELMSQKAMFKIDRGWLYYINSTPYDTLFKVNIYNNQEYYRLDSDTYIPALTKFGLSPDGTTIVSPGGRINTENMSFIIDDDFSQAYGEYNISGNNFSRIQFFNNIFNLFTYNSNTGEIIQTLDLTDECSFNSRWSDANEEGLIHLPGDFGWVIWRGDTICKIQKPDLIFFDSFD